MNSDAYNHSVVKVNTGLERLNKLINVTERLLQKQPDPGNKMVVFDAAAYRKKKAADIILYTFVRRNFWHFINDIISKARNRNYTKAALPQRLLDCIDGDYSYEYSSNYFLKAAETPVKIISKKNCLVTDKKLAVKDRNEPELQFVQFNTFKSVIVHHADEQLVGQLIHSLSGTSVGINLGVWVR